MVDHFLHASMGLADVHNNDATIITLDTGELLAEFTLNPEKNYQRKND